MKHRHKLAISCLALVILTASARAEGTIPVFVFGDASGYGLRSDAVEEIQEWVVNHPNLRLVERSAGNCLIIQAMVMKDSSHSVHLGAVIPIISFVRGEKAGSLLFGGDYSYCFGSSSWGVDSRTLSELRGTLNRIFDSHALTFLDRLFGVWGAEDWDAFEKAAASADDQAEEAIRNGRLKRSEYHENFSHYGENSN